MAIVYPRPPPTHNHFTTAQRTQLLRSNAKLGQVLGSTPHVVDEINTFSRSYATENSKDSRGSIDSLASSSYASSSVARSSIDSHRCSSTPAPRPRPSERAWRIRFPTRRPPILRVGKVPPSSCALETDIPGSPPYDNSAQSPMSFCESDSPPSTPTFNITSEAAMRRQKMRRLAKKFGEGVPVHLVFPPTIESDDEEEEVLVDSPTSSRSSCDSEKELLWEKHTARRSRFVDPPKTSVVTSGRYVVHYQDLSGVHGLSGETFGGLKCTTIPEE
ncbi:hypothetical protein BC835DRAFT_1420892 [Cytidiella melzeri]|nr:hypothetical protein BC835DRAFT_1420892 [Cytidiella melzeri]